MTKAEGTPNCCHSPVSRHRKTRCPEARATLRELRTIAFGKAALVANSAQLIVQARRLPGFADRYVAMVREAAAQRLHAPTGLAGVALDRWLDRFTDSQGRRFSELAARLEQARSAPDIVAGASALGQWRKDILRDSH